jgi:cell shape-determining protein MreD
MKQVLLPILMFFYVVLIQVFIIENLHFSMFFQPFIYLFFVLYLSPTLPKWLSVLMGFMVGIFFDMLFNSPGIHAAATTIIGFLKPYIAVFNNVQAPARENEQGSWLNKSRPKFKYIFLISMVSVHHLIVFVLENLQSSFLTVTLPIFFTSVISSLLLILISDELFHKTFKFRS